MVQEPKPELEVIDAETVEQPDFKGAERDLAIKHGYIKKEKEEQENEHKEQSEDDTKENNAEAAEGKEGKAEQKSEEEVTPQDELTDEQEKEQFKKWNKNETALYIKAKKARARMKAAELERDFLKTKTIYAEKELEKIKKTIDTKKKQEVEPELDEFGEPVEAKKTEVPEDERPLTLKEYRELEQRKESEKKEQLEKQKVINSKLELYEIEAKSEHEDFDEVISLTTDIFNNYKNIYTDEKAQEVKAKLDQWVMAASNILNQNAENIAELAYEIGKLHPKYGKTAKKVEKQEETLSDAKIEKILKPKARTSASISSSGGQPVTEITLEQAAKMTQDEYSKLSKEARDKLLRT